MVNGIGELFTGKVVVVLRIEIIEESSNVVRRDGDAFKILEEVGELFKV